MHYIDYQRIMRLSLSYAVYRIKTWGTQRFHARVIISHFWGVRHLPITSSHSQVKILNKTHTIIQNIKQEHKIGAPPPKRNKTFPSHCSNRSVFLSVARILLGLDCVKLKWICKCCPYCQLITGLLRRPRV